MTPRVYAFQIQIKLASRSKVKFDEKLFFLMTEEYRKILHKRYTPSA